LLGARAALELATDDNATGEEGRELLRRTRDELGQLSELIDPLLRWSTGGEWLQRRNIDLVESDSRGCGLVEPWDGPDRVLIDAPKRLFVRADPKQLRSAIANVVRNALTYSPPYSEVSVLVELENDPLESSSAIGVRVSREMSERLCSTVQQRSRERLFPVWFRTGLVHRTTGARGPRRLDLLTPLTCRGDVRARGAGRGVAAIRVLIVDDHALFADAIGLRFGGWASMRSNMPHEVMKLWRLHDTVLPPSHSSTSDCPIGTGCPSDKRSWNWVARRRSWSSRPWTTNGQ
jgi:hypothetical protein